MLMVVEGVLDRQTAEHYRQHLEAEATWQPGSHTAGTQAVYVKANEQVVDGCDMAVTVGNSLLQVLGMHSLFMSAALPRKIFPPKFNRYQHGGYYGAHVDNAIMHLPDGQLMRTDLSATLFLSDPESYDGGELAIETRYGVQELKLAPGDMVLYPSTSLHEVKPVTSGARVCSFFWIESLVRDSSQREILFDLDQSIQTLTVERGAQDQEVRRLSGVYHNLVRSWADS
ncbi:MAG: Fe2+-dependent dioxygenase [Porticoccaceae bacterium]